LIYPPQADLVQPELVWHWIGNQAVEHHRLCFQEENRALREQLGPRRLRFTDDQRRRLAAKAKILGRRVLREIATIERARRSN
jgi:hypothetical protein